MDKKILLDKGILFLLGSWLLFGRELSPQTLLAALTALFLSALAGCLPEKGAVFCTAALGLCCLFWPPALLFTPLLAYDAWKFSSRLSFIKTASREASPLEALSLPPTPLLCFSWLLPLLAAALRSDFSGCLSALLLSLAALLLRQSSQDAESLRLSYHETQDSMREAALRLEQKNKELMEKQDYEVRLATLDERNRIAREIHDNVGHLLTRSLLQVGAMQVVLKARSDTPQPPASSKPGAFSEELEAQLSSVKSTLVEAMDRIRSSVHGLHEESIDLRMQLLSLTGEFAFCPVRLRYELEHPPREIKYCFLAIVREALNNIARHSNATSASISVLEHPGLYQLTITDNGTPKTQASSGTSPQCGLGLLNMQERVEALQGVFRAESNVGFRLFISIPKERKLS